MDEKEILKRIKENSETMEPPASLQPDAIEKLLTEKSEAVSPAGGNSGSGPEQRKTDGTTPSHTPAEKTRIRRFRRIAQFGSIAAVFALAVLAFTQSERILKHQAQLEAQVPRGQSDDAEAYGDADDTDADGAASDAAPAAENPETTTGESGAENPGNMTAQTTAESPETVTAQSEAQAPRGQSDDAEAYGDADDTDADGAAPDAAPAAENPETTTGQSGTENPGSMTAQTAAESPETVAAQNETQAPRAESATDQDLPGESGTAASAENTATEPAAPLTYAASYEDVYHALYERFGQNYLARSIAYDAGGAQSAFGVSSDADGAAEEAPEAEMAVEDAVTSADYDAAAESGAEDSTAYSRTNLQEAGVDEGDIVKTDGKYIYTLRQNGSLAIVQADADHPTVVSTTDFSGAEDISVHEMYLDGDKLNIIFSRYSSSLASDPDTEVYYTRYGRETVLMTYDISDRSAPAPAGTVTQDGSYEDSRKNGPYIYLFTCYHPTLAETYAESILIPLVNKTQIPADRVYLPESPGSSDYLVISSVDTGSPSEALDSKILVSGASNYYVSTENIYIANEHYGDSFTGTVTELVRFHYADGAVSGAAAGTVRGRLNNSFSMNEYQGMLRVVTTYYGDSLNAVRDFIGDLTGTVYEEDWTEHNGLYILDENLHTVGSIEDLAEGETIRSARFLGDTGYFVTFRQTDPLFSADLSDPAHPQILGELKISGFSSYLHFYGENLLLGIGYEADEETGSVSGLKLSMFDISDPANVQEVSRFVLPGITWCPAIEDYKAILVSPEKNLIGFLCDNRYMVFSYDAENGFTRELLYDFYSDMLAEQAQYYNMRGLYIEDTLYLAGDTFVIAFDMNDSFQKKTVLPVTDSTAELPPQTESPAEAES